MNSMSSPVVRKPSRKGEFEFVDLVEDPFGKFGKVTRGSKKLGEHADLDHEVEPFRIDDSLGIEEGVGEYLLKHFVGKDEKLGRIGFNHGDGCRRRHFPEMDFRCRLERLARRGELNEEYEFEMGVLLTGCNFKLKKVD